MSHRGLRAGDMLRACCIWPWLGPPPAGDCPSHSKALAIFAAAVAAAFAAREVIESPITSFRREEIIQYARQAQIGTQKILSAGDAAYRVGRG